MFFDTAYTRQMLTSETGSQSARSQVIARAVAALKRFIDIYRVVTNSAHIQRLSSVHVRDLFFSNTTLASMARPFVTASAARS
jgi:hypothetical protein